MIVDIHSQITEYIDQQMVTRSLVSCNPLSQPSTHYGCVPSWRRVSLHGCSIGTPTRNARRIETDNFRRARPLSQQYGNISYYLQCSLHSWHRRTHRTRHLRCRAKSVYRLLSERQRIHVSLYQIVAYEANAHLRSPVRDDNDFTFLGEITSVCLNLPLSEIISDNHFSAPSA